MDYIRCFAYWDSGAVNANFQPLEVTDTKVQCNLVQRQRSSQQILDLADYLHIHSGPVRWQLMPIRRYNSTPSFSSEIPLWIELVDPKSFFEYFSNKFESNDVMLIWDGFANKPSNLDDIEGFCRDRKWRCTSSRNVRGSEASVTILYDLDHFNIEFLTRAKTQLVFVTIDTLIERMDWMTGEQRIERRYFI